jgi:uncharacterized damage-inducible protein DinB
MATEEFWLRGPVEGIPGILQPAAHALLQARLEVTELLRHFPEDLLWERPAGLASVGFHLEHLTGVLDRLFTYAREEVLNMDQLRWLKQEGEREGAPTQEDLMARFGAQVDLALIQLKQTDPQTLTAPRAVGRARLPSTQIGLLFHAAEHTMRHTGQLLVTVRILTTQ